jgi:hypothetical protein
MSQYYPQNPYYPPQQAPEGDYDEYEYEDDYYDDNIKGDSIAQRLLIFISGGCLVFICTGCCLLMIMGLWILDPGSGLLATPLPGSDLGLTFDEPAYPDEAVVNDQQVKLSILTVNRNVSLLGVTPVEGQELTVVTIELINLSDETISYSSNDFRLINSQEQAYATSPAMAAVDNPLGRGSLEPTQGIQGRLVFDLIAGETDLVLEWQGDRNAQPRYIYVE